MDYLEVLHQNQFNKINNHQNLVSQGLYQVILHQQVVHFFHQTYQKYKIIKIKHNKIQDHYFQVVHHYLEAVLQLVVYLEILQHQ